MVLVMERAEVLATRKRSGLSRRDRRRAKALAKASHSDEAPGGHTAAWEGGDLGCALGSFCALHKRAEAWSSVTLWQLHQMVPVQAALDYTTPAFDASRTELLAPMPAPHFMRILESIPAMEYGIAWRKFQRCRHLVEGLCSKPASAGFKVALYVRGEQPPPVAFEVRPPRLMLLTLRGGELYFVVHLGPRGKGAHMLQPAMDLEQKLLGMARWQVCHNPVLPRHGAQHEGPGWRMPGRFYCMGAHHCQRGGADSQVENFLPKHCRCGVEGCDWAGAGYQRVMADWRDVAGQWARVAAFVHPTEYGRAASQREQFSTSLAEHRDIMDHIYMGDAHAGCQSCENKTSVSHGSENHAELNVLTFSAPERIARLHAADPKIDLGVWAMERGEVVSSLSPRWEGIFNSDAEHCCIPHRKLLPHVCDAPRLARAATRFVEERTAEALADIMADPSLREGFGDVNDAAAFHSSLVGTTIFKSEWVTNQMLRAARAGRSEFLLRPKENKQGKRKAANVEGGEQGGGEESAVVESAVPLPDVRSLRVGQQVIVYWEGWDPVQGEVREVFTALSESDTRVRVWYPCPPTGDGKPLCLLEHLGQMVWALP